MKYKRLGDYIEPCNEKNTGNEIKLLQGISNRKYFQKAKTNTIGVDLSKYRIVRTGQFAFNRATTRNGDRISIGLRFKEDCIVSPSYRIFKSKDESVLNSEYLMMWFKRPEFDRYARFKSHGSAHEFFDYDEMCEVTLPVPSIERQRQIVAKYNTIADRIKLNEQLNQKLEETAQALYKHWFVDFEFPNNESKPYKSSGGTMVYNEELDTDIPHDWEVKEVDSLINYNHSNYNKEDKFESIYYLDTSSITENKIEDLQLLVVNEDVVPSRAKRKVEHNDIVYSTIRPNLKHYGIIKHPPKNMLVSTGFMVIKPKKESISSELIFMCLTSIEITKYLHAKAEMSVSTYPSIKPEDILKVKIVLPKTKIGNTLEDIENRLKPIFKSHWERNEENKIFSKMKELLLTQMTKIEVEKEIIS